MSLLIQWLLLEMPEAALIVAGIFLLSALIRWRNDAMTRKALRKVTEDLKQVADQRRPLTTNCHPDCNLPQPCADEVRQAIVAPYRPAIEKLASGAWEGHGVLTVRQNGGTQRELRYLRMRRFELGECYIGETFVAYALEKANRDLFDAAVRTIGSFRYADDAMKREASRALPQVQAVAETADRLVLILHRNADMVMLGDLIGHFGGRLDPKHAAWVISGLVNLGCYLEWAGLMHGAIAPDTVFVSPKHHSVALLGGWWYAMRVNEKLRALPQRSLDALPPIAADAKRAACAVDSELIRLLGREMLGDPAGTKLLHDRSIPAAFAQWTAHPPANSAFADYCSWEKACEASFGRRKSPN